MLNYIINSYCIILISGILILITSIFSMQTLLGFSVIAGGFYLFIEAKKQEIKKYGLIHYLSEENKNTLLKRSVFDLLCDF